jgi:hypothetical protein
MAKSSRVHIISGAPKDNVYINLQKYYPSDSVNESIILTGGKKVTIIVVEEDEE